MPISEKIKRLISLLPNEPGVYLMKDSDDKIIYIGKAKNLKNRVSQYFLRPQIGKVAAMVSHADHFDFIIVHTDKEAFILEMNLIQTHYPRYNIMMMDNSHYPYIAIRREDAFLSIARRANDPKHYYYFGPFPNAKDAFKVIDLLNRIYPTRKCKNLGKKVCLYYHLGQCLAPCEKKVESEVYQDLYAKIKTFLDGNASEVLKEYEEKMIKASEELRFEDAKYAKDIIDSIKRITSKQSVEISTDRTSRDVFAYSERDGYLALSILTYRNGMLLGKRNIVVSSFLDGASQAIEMIEEYYQKNDMPKEIACNIEGVNEINEIYPEIKIISPKEGRLMEQVNIAALNAKEGLDRHFVSARLEDDNNALLEELGSLLGIKTPYRIELFDNSHMQGSNPVGAMVCYINGEPIKQMYRKFHLEKENAGDDYHSMIEVVTRRYKRLKDENLEYPDLILTDGGLPQVHATLNALNAIDVDIPVYGLYKNDKHQTEGIIDNDGVIYPLDNKSPLFFLLMRMQDEVHRFAISFHKNERLKSMHSSLFDGIKGIGEKRKETLRRNYPTIDSLMNASLQELKQILPEEAAKALYEKIRE